MLRLSRIINRLLTYLLKALIANAKSLNDESVQRGSRRRMQVWDYNPLSASLLHQALSRNNWKYIIAAIDAKSDTTASIYTDFE